MSVNLCHFIVMLSPFDKVAVIILMICTVGFQPAIPDCMKPDPVPGEKRASKKLRKKSKKKSASDDVDWVPELEEVSYAQ